MHYYDLPPNTLKNLKETMQNGSLLQDIQKSKFINENNLKILRDAPEKPLHDKAILLAVIQNVLNKDIKLTSHFNKDHLEKIIFSSLPETLKNDEEIFSIAINASEVVTCLEWAGEKLKNNQSFFQYIVENYEYSYKWASEELKVNPDFFKAAINKSIHVLRDAPYKIKNNQELVLISMQKDPINLIYASDNIKNNKQLALPVLQQDLNLYHFFPVFQNDFDITLLAVKKNGENLRNASDNMKNNIDIVLAALQNDPEALIFAGLYFENHYINAKKYKEEIQYRGLENIYDKKKVAGQYAPALITEILEERILKEKNSLTNIAQTEKAIECDLFRQFVKEFDLTEQFEAFKSKKKSVIKL